MAKVFSSRLGVLSGFVFQRSSPGDTTLSESRYTRWLFKVGTSSHNWLTIGCDSHTSLGAGPMLKFPLHQSNERHAEPGLALSVQKGQH